MLSEMCLNCVYVDWACDDGKVKGSVSGRAHFRARPSI